MTEVTAKPPTYEPVSGTPADPEVQHEARTQHRIDPDGTLHMMTEIGDGVFVQWSQCARCGKHISECKDADGPVEPEYMQRWRTQRFAKSFAERGIAPRATPYAVRELLAEAQEAADAAYGDSNDSEIELLRGVAEGALSLLGLRFPDGRDPDDDDEGDDLEDEDEDEEDEDDVSPVEYFHGRATEDEDELEDPRSLVETVADEADAIDNGFDAALAAARATKENPDVGF